MIKSIWRGSLKDIMPSNILADEKMAAAAEALDRKISIALAENRRIAARSIRSFSISFPL